MRVSSSFARASTSASGTSTVASSTIASSAAARNSDSMRSASRSSMRSRMFSRSSSSVSKPAASEANSSSEVGQVLVLDVLDLDLELRVLAGDVLGAVVLGERRRDRAPLALDGADEALLEAGDEVARAELDELVAALAAGEGLAADGALEVDRQEVAVLRGALDRVQVRGALAQVLDLLVDGLLRRRTARAGRPRCRGRCRARRSGARRPRTRRAAACPRRACRRGRPSGRRPARCPTRRSPSCTSR